MSLKVIPQLGKWLPLGGTVTRKGEIGVIQSADNIPFLHQGVVYAAAFHLWKFIKLFI